MASIHDTRAREGRGAFTGSKTQVGQLSIGDGLNEGHSDPAPQISPTTSPRRVLVVDDNMDAAEVTAELLRTFGHDVQIAHDGPGALALIDAFEPEVAILDLGLPVMDGYELAGRIHAQWRERAPRLIALSGYGQPQDRLRSEAAGFVCHLVKPVEIDELAERVSQA